MLRGNTWYSVYLTRQEPGIFRIEFRVDLLGYLLIVHLVNCSTLPRRNYKHDASVIEPLA